MRLPADRRDDNALIGDCASAAMAFLQHRLRFEHRDRFATAEIVEHVGRTRPAAGGHTRAALELLRDQGWLQELDGVWSLTEAGRQLQLSSVASLATFLGFDTDERAVRARHNREAVARSRDVVEADLAALGRALADGGVDRDGEGGAALSVPAPLFPTVELRVYHLSVRSDAAFAAWDAMRARVRRTGFWPVVLGSPEHVEVDVLLTERWAADEPTAEQSLAEAAATDPDAWLALRERERERDACRNRHQLRDEPFPHGPWPEVTAPLQALTPPEGEVATLALFPTPHCWEVAAHLHWFVGNADLRPADHVRLQRRWAERHGAELVNVRGQAVAQFLVTRPPRDRETALRLATEHFEYCPDRVYQSTEEETLEALASELLDATVWHFWWD